MSPGRAALAAAALMPLLGGCVAAVALPALIGSGLMVRSDHRVRAATKVARGAPTVELKTEAGKAEDADLTRSGATVSKTTAPPPPDGAADDGAWSPFVAYALAQAQAKPPLSALLAPGSRIDTPVRRACTSATPAVIVDLDDAATPFAPERATANPSLAAALVRLRAADVVVLWITRLPAARASEVAQWVRSSGLDPQAQDQFLLVRNADDRKQLLREDANRDVCVVAIAGSARGDFDELFDYLLDPAKAIGLEPMIGQGWFEVPPLVPGPVAPPPSAAPAPSQAPATAP